MYASNMKESAMDNISFHVSIPAGKALELVKDKQNATLVHEEDYIIK